MVEDAKRTWAMKLVRVGRFSDLGVGVFISALISVVAYQIGEFQWSKDLGFSAILFAIIIGMLIGNTFYPKIEQQAKVGVSFAKGTLLRTGIILYGFRVTFQQIDAVGSAAIVTDAVMVAGTFLFTLLLGVKLFKLDKQTVFLTAAGCSICGAAAIMATEPVVRGESHKVAVALSVVVIFGTCAIFLYPIIYQLQGTLFNQQTFGIYVGSTVHEVAQVVAAGRQVSPITGDYAVITKMIRVMMIAPFLLILSNFVDTPEDGSKRKITIPWFAVFFILVAIFNSFDLLPHLMVSTLIQIDSLFLIMAMAALGLTTQASAIKQAGIKPIILGACTFIWLIFGGGVINYYIGQIL